MAKVKNKFLDQAPATTLKGNNTGSTANVTDLSIAQVNAMLGPMTTGGDIIYGGASGVPTRLPNGSAGQILTSNGGTSAPSWQPAPGTVSAFFASSQVTTTSSAVTSTSFVTFDNSPAFTFVPSITGTYKIYCSCPLLENTVNSILTGRIFNTTGSATLLQESQASVYSPGIILTSNLIQSVYTLTAGVTYVFDIQAMVTTGGSGQLDGTASPFYMFAELEVSASAAVQPVAYLREEQAGTPGGTSAGPGYQTRVLNTIDDPGSIVTGFNGSGATSANQFELGPGTYRIDAKAPAVQVNGHQAYLYNVTDNNVTFVGSSEYTLTGVNHLTSSIIMGVFTITSTKIFSLSHWTQTAYATYGLGIPVGDGTYNQVYSQVTIEKLG